MRDADIENADEIGDIVYDCDNRGGVITKKLLENIEDYLKNQYNENLVVLRVPPLTSHLVTSITIVCDLDEEKCLSCIDKFVMNYLNANRVGIAKGESNAVFFVW